MRKLGHALEANLLASIYLTIYNNPQLATLTGFDDLDSIGGNFGINNTIVSTFPDFSGLLFVCLLYTSPSPRD